MLSFLFFFSVVLLSISCAEQSSSQAETQKPETPGSGTAAGEERLLSDPGDPPPGAEREFSTDFSRATVRFDSILSGGPSKDGIPSIDDPGFVSVEEADRWIEESEPVLLLRYAEHVRIYPLQILMWHEIVNDSIDGDAVAVTYCPLCNTGVAFRAAVEGTELTFGTTGRLRYSNLIMYDRQTETWWQQASGKAIAGRYAGITLELLPVTLLSWKQAKDSHPQAEVLSRNTGYSKPYGTNPYEGYDTSSSPFLYEGPETDGEHDPFERLLFVQAGEEERAYLYGELREKRVVRDHLGGRPIALFWASGTSSALDTGTISKGREVGTAAAHFPFVEDTEEELTFYWDGNAIRDRETNSEWSVAGVAVDGQLEGSSLSSPVTVNHLWFSFSAFQE